MIRILRSSSLVVLVLMLAGCKLSLTNRIEVNADGSALVHVITTVDDQLYSLAQSQSKGTDPFAKPVSTPGWETTRRVTEAGDHVIDARKHVGSISEIQPALAAFYSGAASSATPAKSMSGISPASWKFTIEQKPGLFTRTIHFHADVPKLIPDAKPARADSSQQFGEEMGRAVLSSMLTVNTELKVPGKVTSSSGEELADGRIRFTHPLSSPSSIDVTAEMTDYGHVVIAVLVAIAAVALLVFAILRRGRPVPAL